MKLIILILGIISLSFFAVNYVENPILIAIDFKKTQYIHFKDSYKMLHKDSDLTYYKRFENNQDFREFKKYQGNFSVDDIQTKIISNDERIISFNLRKPDIAKVIPVFGERKELKDLLDKENLPSVDIPVSVHLKKQNLIWKVLIKEKSRPLQTDNK